MGRLGTMDMGRKLGAVPPFWGRGPGSLSSTLSLGSRPTFLPSDILIHRAIWPQQIWAENWGLCPFRRGVPGSPSNTMWPGPRPTYLPSFIWIHLTVWPQNPNRFTNGRPKTVTRGRNEKFSINNSPIRRFKWCKRCAHT